MIQRLPMASPTLGASDSVTSQRFEMKYMVSSVQAEEIRNYIGAFMEPDAKALHGHSYPLSSLYLDSPNMNLFWSSNLGEKNRYKLRVRSYSDNPAEPLFCEVKRRMNGVILKRRAAIRREHLAAILRGQHPCPDMVLFPGELDNLHHFAEKVRAIQARPCLHVRYRREAYMSAFGDPVRVTFDTRLACLPVAPTYDRVRLNGEGWRHLDHFPTILELKFTDSFPRWMHEMVTRFRLRRDSCAKYVVCIKQMAREGVWFLNEADKGAI